ncbi:NUDIX hydrolase [Rothia nasimurium]|uniref:NUDIX hydrolase n=1 Tax=Rothia nasimurium TaxID=85336 RepID=UPI001F24B921|nr:NUDIX hydrolase [Rothia nasimurium]
MGLIPEWIPVFQAPGTDVVVQKWLRPDGQIWWRVCPSAQQLAGAVAVLVSSEGKVLLVRQSRPAVGQVLWELPRGGTLAEDGDAVATATRELYEETGFEASDPESYGVTYPDSGLLGSEVGVVRLSLGPATGTPDGETEGWAWFSPGELRNLVVEGSLRDSMSLAALVIAGIF